VALAAGHAPATIDELRSLSWVMRVVHVAPTRGEARRAAEAPFMGYQRKMSILRTDSTGGSIPNSFDRSLLHLRPFREYLDNGWLMVGSPDEIADDLRAFVETTGYQRILLVMDLPGLDTRDALRSMRLFSQHVAPFLTSAPR